VSVTKIEGFKELDRALRDELPRATAKNASRRAMIDAMKPVEARAKQLAPVAEHEGGQLRDSITTKPVKAKRISRTRYASSNTIEVATGPTGREEGGNAAWQEFGTVKMPPKGYMRGAADAEGENTVERLRDHLTTQIEKAKARIARKAARGK
jgi:HK97 gp10 family phage protein